MANKDPRLTTPKGISQYTWLNRADSKFDEHGAYKVNLIVPAKVAAPFQKAVAKLRDDAFKLSKTKKKADLPFAKEEDDDGKPTGNVILKLKVKNRMTKDGDLWERKPKFFDASGKRCDVKIGNGSTLKATVECFVWDSAKDGVGISLQPVAIQVLDLVEYTGDGGGSAEEYGFEAEDGYVADEEEEFEDNDVETDTEEEDEDLY